MWSLWAGRSRPCSPQPKQGHVYASRQEDFAPSPACKRSLRIPINPVVGDFVINIVRVS